MSQEPPELPPLLSGIANLCGMMIAELLIVMDRTKDIHAVLRYLQLAAQATLAEADELRVHPRVR